MVSSAPPPCWLRCVAGRLLFSEGIVSSALLLVGLCFLENLEVVRWLVMLVEWCRLVGSVILAWAVLGFELGLPLKVSMSIVVTLVDFVASLSFAHSKVLVVWVPGWEGQDNVFAFCWHLVPHW